ncbi:hypothetical protein BJ165DRAFT_1426676, partial [Panaeolus papilionaceus]
MLTVWKQLYHICNGSESRRVDASESRRIYDSDTESNGDGDVGLGVAPHEMVHEITDPNTGCSIDWASWSMWRRWNDFSRRYKKSERDNTRY